MAANRVEKAPGGAEVPAVVAAARDGDEAAFLRSSSVIGASCKVHCYRMLGSFEGLRRISSRRRFCVRGGRERPSRAAPRFARGSTGSRRTPASTRWRGARAPRLPTGGGRPLEVPWLQPYPDDLLQEVASRDDEPDAKVVARETIELAFIAAIQLLPPGQRVALIARDVLGWSAAEAPGLLDVSVAALNSALQRARATLRRAPARGRLDWAPDADPTEDERALVERYIEASEHGDPAAMVELMREDAFFAMPPQPLSVVGSKAIVDLWVEGGSARRNVGSAQVRPRQGEQSAGGRLLRSAAGKAIPAARARRAADRGGRRR